MILTSVDPIKLMAVLPQFRQTLSCSPLAERVLRLVTTEIPEGDLMRLSTDRLHHRQAIDLCCSFGFGILDRDPKAWFTWDGQNVACGMEPSVIIHEVAHYQCAAPYRRTLPDFGLGAGPETGVGTAAANAVRVVTGADADVEEGLSSLLGILWEAELGQPAILAFLEQNWLEGGVDVRNVAHFVKMVATLEQLGLIDQSGHPTRGLRDVDDAPFFDRYFS